MSLVLVSLMRFMDKSYLINKFDLQIWKAASSPNTAVPISSLRFLLYAVMWKLYCIARVVCYITNTREIIGLVKQYLTWYITV